LRILKCLALLLALTLASCTSITDLKSDLQERFFGKEKADVPELKPIKASLQTKVEWKSHIGESPISDFTPGIDKDFAYFADEHGELAKVDTKTGKDVWRIATGEPFSGGVGLASNLVLLGTATGYVNAYDSQAKPLWKTKLTSQILSVPQVFNDVVVVRCGDSRIYGLDAKDGAKKWVYERSSPPLSIRSSAGVAVDGGVAYAGFAGGKLVAINIEDGKLIWEVSISQPKGANEIERISDVTSAPVVDGSLVYAVAYQGKLDAVDRARGRVVWSRDLSSYSGITADTGRIYLSHAQGAVYSIEYNTGNTFWRQGDLHDRMISAPLSFGSVLAVGDVEGYVHFISREEGNIIGRVQLDNSPIMPVMAPLNDHTLLVQNRSGDIYAVSFK
jgi:outer membrane protein assembly factor BamB